MNQGIAKFTALFLATAAGTAAASCLTDTTQANFQAGTLSAVDIATSPGDVLLAKQGSLDQQNTTTSVYGTPFSTTAWVGQTFTAGASGSMTRADITLACSFCSGVTPSIIVSLRATSGGLPTGADLATATIPGIDTSGAAAFYAFVFGTPVNISAGTQYALVIRPSAAYGSGTLALPRGGTSNGGLNAYAGGALINSSNSGSSWNVQSFSFGDSTADAAFKTYVGGGYGSAGTWTSSLKDAVPPTGTTPTWTTLSFTDNLPANTAVKFQAAASTSSGGPFNFVGPDGTANTYFTSSGAALSQFNGSRYFKYRAYLSSNSSSSTPALNDATVCFSNVSANAADLSITNSDGVASATPGGSVAYTITAANAGPASATSVKVADAFPAGLTCSWTCSGAGGGTCTASGSGSINETAVTLPSGASVTYHATCSIAASATGSLVNTATVSSSTISDSNAANNTATDTDTLAPQADLSITNTDNATTATPGGSVTYVITATNGGPSNAPGAIVGDTFPAALTCSWTCAGSNGGTCTASGSGNINATVNLPAGASVTHTATCSISAAASGTLSNTASVNAPSGVSDPNTGNNSAIDSDTLSATTNVVLTMTDNVDMVRVGDVVDYVIEITNSNGTSNASVTVGDTLPAQLTSGSWVCTASGGASCGSAGGSGNKLSDSPTLPAGGKVDYIYTATVVSSNANGEVANTATAKVTSAGNQSALNLSANDADVVVIFVSSFESGAAKLAASTASGSGSASMTLHLGVDAGLAASVGTTPVTIASGRAANGATLFSVQLVRLGGALAMRTLVALDGGAFSDASPWARANLGNGTLDLTWQAASPRGDDGYLRAGSLPLRATDAHANLDGLQIVSERGVPWLVAIPN